MPTVSSGCLRVLTPVLSEGLRLWCLIAGLALCFPPHGLSAQTAHHDRGVVHVVLVDATTLSFDAEWNASGRYRHEGIGRVVVRFFTRGSL
jgi:hypothetical protein